MLVSQAIYAAYCESFPDSYRLFNEDFKEDIIKVVHEWMTGRKSTDNTHDEFLTINSKFIQVFVYCSYLLRNI